MTDPTPGAMRAAKVVALQPPRVTQNIQQIAAIIDRETALPQLAEACLEHRRWGRHDCTCHAFNPDDKDDFDESRCDCSLGKAHAALAAFEKGGR